MNELSITSKNSRFPLNEETFPELKEEVKQGNLERLQLFIELFSKAISHPFLREKNPIATTFAKYIVKKSIKGVLEDKIKTLLCVGTFRSYDIFSTGNLPKNVEFVCKDGVVHINKQLLCYFSDVFKAMLTSFFKEKEKDEGLHRLNYEEKYHCKAVQILKDYIYTGNLLSFCVEPTFESIRDAVEFLSFANYAQVRDIKISPQFEVFKRKIYSSILDYRAVSEEKLEEMLLVLQSLSRIDEKFILLFISAIKDHMMRPISVQLIERSDVKNIALICNNVL